MQQTDNPRNPTAVEGFYKEEGGKRESSAQEKRTFPVQDEGGFSLAELWCFPMAGLVAGQEENLPPAGIESRYTFLLEMQGWSRPVWGS